MHGCDICIISSKSGIDFLEKAQHVHDSYEFTVPYTTMPYLSLEDKIYSGEKGKIYPMNSGQAHGPNNRMLNKHLISLNVDKDTLNEIAYTIFGKSNVCFKQGNYIFTNELKTMMKSFVEEYNGTQPGRKLVLKSLSTQIVVYLLRHIESNMSLPISLSYNASKKNIDKAIEYLRDQYDSEYSLEEAAKVAYLSPYHFIKVFKSYTGKTPYEYLMCIKIQKAKELLSLNNLSITEVCFACGFNNPSNFTTFFKQKVGVPPSEYRKIMNR